MKKLFNLLLLLGLCFGLVGCGNKSNDDEYDTQTTRYK